jgi:glycosyltransferase involved in cell wall biosynthesis
MPADLKPKFSQPKKTTDAPKVSVIMPAFNTQSFIAAAIESILRQSFIDFELIIINDFSCDQTGAIIDHYQAKDKRIVSVKNRQNLGIAASRNKGLELARARYIAWQDADDISLPRRLQLQYQFLEKHPEIAIVGGYLEFFNEKGSLNVRRYAADDATLRRRIFRFSPVAQPSAMIRKSCLNEVGPYDLRYPPAEDLDMSFRLGMRHRFANINQVLLRYRQHNNSATFFKLATIEKNTIEIRKRYFKHPAYNATFFDRLYNFLQQFSIYIVPPKIKIHLFNLLRNSRH